MKYRPFKSIEDGISVLSLGVLQIPWIAARLYRDWTTVGISGESQDIGVLIRHAVDGGINYIDLGHAYLLKKDDPVFNVIAAALSEFDGKPRVSLPLPVTRADKPEKLEIDMNDLMKRFRLNRVNTCLLEGLDRRSWAKLRDAGLISWLEKALASGKFDDVGFSFHDDAHYLREIINSFDGWSHCRFQHSFIDSAHHPGIGGFKFATIRNLPVIITNPTKGGGLLRNLPDNVKAVWGDGLIDRSIAEWCMRSVWNHSEVTSVIGDIYDTDRLSEALLLADSEAAEHGNLNVTERLMLNNVRDAYNNIRPVSCTACRCCKPCPRGLDFVRLFEITNDAAVYGDTTEAKLLYAMEGFHAENCNLCGYCLKTCPKSIPIPVAVSEGVKRLFSDDRPI